MHKESITCPADHPDYFLLFFFTLHFYGSPSMLTPWPFKLRCAPPLLRSVLPRHCNLVNCPGLWRCNGGIHIVLTNRVIRVNLLNATVAYWHGHLKSTLGTKSKRLNELDKMRRIERNFHRGCSEIYHVIDSMEHSSFLGS